MDGVVAGCRGGSRIQRSSRGNKREAWGGKEVAGCLRDNGVEEVPAETSTRGAFSVGENEF
jgi:hypothetical protein